MIKDISGQTFGRLTVVSLPPVKLKGEKYQWRCRCSCGGWTFVRIDRLNSGHTKSCGCIKKERIAAVGRRRKVHGLSRRFGNSHYRRWEGIKQRTGNPRSRDYAGYGGRGIGFHKPWADSFILFKSWLDDNLGPCPDGHSLDRIDNNGNYEPNNLRWASALTQTRNRRKQR